MKPLVFWRLHCCWYTCCYCVTAIADVFATARGHASFVVDHDFANVVPDIEVPLVPVFSSPSCFYSCFAVFLLLLASLLFLPSFFSCCACDCLRCCFHRQLADTVTSGSLCSHVLMASIVFACDVVVIDDLLALSPLVANVLTADAPILSLAFLVSLLFFSTLQS
jgi:hypothetical protein